MESLQNVSLVMNLIESTLNYNIQVRTHFGKSAITELKNNSKKLTRKLMCFLQSPANDFETQQKVRNFFWRINIYIYTYYLVPVLLLSQMYLDFWHQVYEVKLWIWL